jgi:hypothetical protein
MQKRRNTSALPALTPEIPTLTPQIHKLATINNDNITRLERKIANLKAQVAVERRRHAKLETVHLKYFAILEAVLADQRAAFLQLGKPLVPNALQKGSE